MKTKIFLIAMISFYLLSTSTKAETIHIQLPATNNILNYAWAAGDTFIVHKPVGFSSTIWRIDNTVASFIDSLVFVPTEAGNYWITAAWNMNIFDVVLHLIEPIKKSLDVCQSQDFVNLGSISKGFWQGNGVILSSHGLYPVASPAGTYLLYCYDLMSNNLFALTAQLIVTIHPIPNIMISTPPTLDVTETYDLSEYVTPNKGGVWTGKGVINADYSSYLNAAIAGVGTHMLQYTYTDPRSGCSASQVEYIKIK